jgi:predicted Zn finger-like uncharacterized protein
MIIVCPQCESRYELSDDSLPEAGRAVRCTRCRAEWLAFPEPDEAQAPSAPANAAHLDGTMSEDGDEVLTAAAIEDAFRRDAEPHATEPHHESVEEVAARASPKPRKAKRAGRRWRMLPKGRHLALVASLAAVACLVELRGHIVASFPSAASLYARIGLDVNLRGLAFDEVRTTTETDAQTPVLVIEGTIRNISSSDVDVPRLRLAVRDGKSVELYSWTTVPARTILPPGQTLDFRSRLASPPAEGRSVAVRFLRRDDMLAVSK